MRAGTVALAVALLLAPAGGAAHAQGGADATSGVFVRSYRFDPGVGVQRITQWGVPIGASARLSRRVTFDLSTAWASTQVTMTDAGNLQLSGLTDVEVRASYALGRDAVILSLTGNLPTGAAMTASTRVVSGSAASTVIAYPVTQFSSGFGATAATALARRVGGINVGVGLAVRWGARFQPLSDVPSQFTPATEARAQLSADGLVGAGQLGVSVTTSLFTKDKFAITSPDPVTTQFHQPGLHNIIALNYVAPIGRATIVTDGWVFIQGASGDSAGPAVGPHQVIGNIGILVAIPVGASMSATPRVQLRQGTRGAIRDRLMTVELGWTLVASHSRQLYGAGRYSQGFVTSEATGNRSNVSGWGMSLGLRLGW